MLTTEAPDRKEFENLVRSGTERLKDAESTTNSLYSRFDLSYNAAFALSLAALRRKGYRPANRYVVFQVLPHTLGLGPEVWRVLDMAHGKRNRTEYEGVMDIDERTVTDVIDACRKVAAKVASLPAIGT